MTDRVRKDDVIPVGVERLSWPEQFARERRGEHVGPGLGRAVQNKYRLAVGRAYRRVMQAQLGQNLPRVKPEVAYRRGPFPRRGKVRGQAGKGAE